MAASTLTRTDEQGVTWERDRFGRWHRAQAGLSTPGEMTHEQARKVVTDMHSLRQQHSRGADGAFESSLDSWNAVMETVIKLGRESVEAGRDAHAVDYRTMWYQVKYCRQFAEF